MKIALINTFFDGYDIWDHGSPVFNWLWATLLSRKKDLSKIANRQVKPDLHPLTELINSHNPDLIIATELLPYIGGQGQDILKQAGYQIALGHDNVSRPQNKRCVLIASKFEPEIITDFPNTNYKHYGGVCILDHTNKLIICGVHLSPYKHKHRDGYLKHIRRSLKAISKEFPEYKIILGGDFNTDPEIVQEFFPKHKTVNVYTFPSIELYHHMHHPFWSILLKYLKIEHSRKKFDQLYFDQDLIIKSVDTLETISDHEAVIVEI